MKFLPLFALSALIALTGCQTTYKQLTVTNFDGEPVSAFVAEGRVAKREHGYEIRAVERYVHGDYPVTRRFPNGWRTTVVGANVIVEEVEKPAWLVAMDAGQPVDLEVFEFPTGWPKKMTTTTTTTVETRTK